ncbi:MAG: hypothetical protein F6J94_25000, partial [Moorea sp. SIO1F2]
FGILHSKFTILHSDRQPWPKGHAIAFNLPYTESPWVNNLGQKATQSRSTLAKRPRNRVQPPTFNLQPICH